MRHPRVIGERPAWDTVLLAAVLAGIAAATATMALVLPAQAWLGAPPAMVFRSIASGLVGRGAFQGGDGWVALGVALQLAISIVAAGAYALAASRLPLLLRRPTLCGMAFGILVYLAMTFVVVPLSAVGYVAPANWRLPAVSLAIHIFAFGLPIGLIVKRVMGPRA